MAGMRSGFGAVRPIRDACVAKAAVVVGAAVGIAGCAQRTEAGVFPEPAVSPAAAFTESSGTGGPAGREPPAAREEVQEGLATWYGAAFAGRRTASGEPFNPLALTAAHRTLPFGTWVEVTRVDTGASVRVRITDRGPFGHADRIIDLSRGAADRIGLVRSGVARVELRVVDAP